MLAEALKKEYLPKYSEGEIQFYRLLLFSAVKKMLLISKGEYKGISPELEYLEYHSQFLTIYRREGEPNYLHIAKLFRRAAHRIYRLMLKRNLTTHNLAFLHLVSPL